MTAIDAGEGKYDFYVNLDNIHLQTEIKANEKEDPRILEARYKYGMVLVGLGIIRMEECLKRYDLRPDQITRLIEFSSAAVSPMLLPIISGLGELQLSE